ncbi:NAD(P)-dependent oxidoreductase [Actinomadura sp. DC4]|uniref:NAD-dependent epimerase/dehydratase family protein n=1 Tax=Actinomadura sp. DC4 TaxID=3055069 RepID=UPI0025AF373A|nr:NAD(P)-dependent oxidoreductase [Actinomadura sp. DC4]MDN3354710.1 NAD(P)-dependent oxidoreductase [Actinomadura sp. DC4]
MTVLAAGLPGHHLPESENAREAALVRETIARCRAGGHQLVFFSTTSMYGGPGNNGREDEPVIPSTAYGRHKFDLETLIRDEGVDHLILRLTQVVGPEEPDFRLLPTLMKQLATGGIQVHRHARRDLLYIDDFVTVVDGLLSTRPMNEVVNVASGECVPVGQIIDHLAERLGITAERQVVDDGIAYCSSIAKLRATVPEVAGIDFSPGYYKRVIDRYLKDGR